MKYSSQSYINEKERGGRAGGRHLLNETEEVRVENGWRADWGKKEGEEAD